MPSPPLSATLLHTRITFVCVRPPKLCFRAAPARWATQHCPFCYACWGRPMARAGRRPPPAWGQRAASVWGFASLACAGHATTRPYGQEVLLRSPSQPQEAVVFSACLRLGLHKLAFAVAAVVRSHAVWVYTDTSALETYEHTSYTVPHIVNRSMWMGRHRPSSSLWARKLDWLPVQFGGESLCGLDHLAAPAGKAHPAL